MKEKLIETCGRLWNELGARGETSAYELSHTLKEDEEMVNLALGWLAREDKVQCSKKRRERVFSLVASELEVFRGFYGDNISKSRKSFWSRLFR